MLVIILCSKRSGVFTRKFADDGVEERGLAHARLTQYAYHANRIAIRNGDIADRAQIRCNDFYERRGIHSERKKLGNGEEVKKIEGPVNVNRGTKGLMMQIQNEMKPIQEEESETQYDIPEQEDIAFDDFPTEIDEDNE